MMMSRTSLRLSSRVIASEPCLLCTSNRSHGPVQKRYMAARRAPSTRHKQWRQKERALTPEGLEHKKKISDLEALLAESTYLTEAQRMAVFAGNQKLALRISSRVTHFIHEFRKSPGLDEDFQVCMRRNGVTLKEIYQAQFVLRNLGTPPQAAFGRTLVKSCDAAGYPEATIQVVASLLRQDIAEPGRLRTRDAFLAQGRLKELSKNGNLRARVLEGKLAERSGDPRLAVELYQSAADGFAERRTVANMEAIPDASGTESNTHLDELSSPWMELGILHLRRGDRTKALQAYMLGIELDDPMAHLMLGRLDYQLTGGQYTPDWLYNTTKAAASGHFKAAFSLGEYYANTKAPPPPKEGTEGTQTRDTFESDSPNPTSPNPTSFFTRIYNFFTTGFLKPNLDTNSRTAIGHFAAAVSDPVSRLHLAYEWLKVSSDQSYLPARLELARLHCRKSILPEHNLSAPFFGPGSGKEIAEPIANPLYKPEQGRTCLYYIFLAHRDIRRGRREAGTKATFKYMVGLWAQYPDVLEDYEPELDNLLEEAKTLADTLGIDVFDENEVLVYRHQGFRGHGLLEYDEVATVGSEKWQSLI